jgi:hypothetical protein
MQLQEPPQGIMRQPAKGCSGDAAWYIPHRTLMRPLVVKRQITPMSGFFAFFRFFLALSSLGNVS